MKNVNIAILGLGNIGTGVYKALAMNGAHIASTTGLDITVAKIFEKDTDRDRGIDVAPSLFTQDEGDIFGDPAIDIVVELIGGVDFATSLMFKAVAAGKHVVTANKAALAANFEQLTGTAEGAGVMLRYEASVGGGIPIIGPLTTSLLANRYEELMGILNGTTNYILTKMTQEGRPYGEVLQEAQAKGFAEADPSGDVEGEDLANKLSILMSLVFGKRVLPSDIPTTGITGITMDDIRDAEKADCVIKLVASAFRQGDGAECFIQPVLLNKGHPLASVNDEYNALYIKGNAVDDLMFYGKGAGPLPTASAVLGDVIEIGRAIG
ncbi:MAG: homoserine dehydrogenase [Clostridiales Family XIII bacterium]|jgi:homoserine dehydrogenase|nr:homoserine dehydrogenase [Clostridiales Family XIII bacterium]